VSRESHDQPLAAIDRGAKAVLQTVDPHGAHSG
jgi:hypothetical protein